MLRFAPDRVVLFTNALPTATAHDGVFCWLKVNSKLARLLNWNADYEDYQVVLPADGLSGLTAARENSLLVVLGWMLPGFIRVGNLSSSPGSRR